MRRRRKIRNVRRDKKRFSRTASGSHKKNFRAHPMRGGIRA
jgi:ribosomal protein L35